MRTIWLLSLILVAGFTFIITRAYFRQDVGQQPVLTPIVAPTVQRDLNIPQSELQELLWHYDNDPVHMKWTTMSQTPDALKIHLEGNLFQRSWTQDAIIPIAQSGGWKLGLGIGLGVAATLGVGYLTYKLFK